ncbi:SelT/SelW/SelH family protein Ecym_1539 [Eremothecium cymbalariae DBVPG|uniref:Uncharacterized protein n=1 Tax=Eremothecium cymbalariae (strain CBS 270.75 / DBVPG 7215 / KCTC 17166 / NRRL Y-17582) TaxID=931890 RepID=G8JMU4_ERECY|nr:hypothetical protein Ecym_1539 [Eremothecium cymbalariae DBVPG\
MPYPKVSIIFCTRCKWNLRSAWYLQELLQTFGDSLGEVSLIPGSTGIFKVLGYLNQDQETAETPIVIWDRKANGGFPDSKFLKQKVKELLFVEDKKVELGHHIKRDSANDGNLHGGTLVQEGSRENFCIKESDCDECNV